MKDCFLLVGGRPRALTFIRECIKIPVDGDISVPLFGDTSVLLSGNTSALPLLRSMGINCSLKAFKSLSKTEQISSDFAPMC